MLQFRANYVKLTAEHPPNFETKVLFLAQSGSGLDTVENIIRLLKDTLYFTITIDFDLLMQNFTFVDDCAVEMPTVVESSISTAWNKWDESWSPCIVHMLNTAMKNAKADVEKSNEVHAV